MAQSNDTTGEDLQGQPRKEQQSAMNPASAQGGQGEQGLPSRTSVDPTQIPGSTGTQMDQQGRPVGADGKPSGQGTQGGGNNTAERHEERRQGGDRRQSDGQPK
ncbi:MAG: hypothetical protein QM777_08860 [Pseudorhodoferax sp.]